MFLRLCLEQFLSAKQANELTVQLVNHLVLNARLAPLGTISAGPTNLEFEAHTSWSPPELSSRRGSLASNERTNLFRCASPIKTGRFVRSG